jgi:ATP-grasp domain
MANRLALWDKLGAYMDGVAEGINSLGQCQPSVLIAAAKWWPASARLSMALHRHGCRISVICPVGHPLTQLTCVHQIFQYRALASLNSLRRALRECRPDVVIPCDDGVVAQLHELYNLDASLKGVIERSLGSPQSYPVVNSRFQLLDSAMKMGIKVPTTRRVTNSEDLVKWHHEFSSGAVLKIDGESGGNGVRISHSLSDSLSAWKSLRTPYSLATAWKRMTVDRDPLSLWSRRHHDEREVTVQELIVGRPANCMVACWGGKLLAVMSVIVVAAEGNTGAATIVRVIHNECIESAAQQLVSRLNLSGFYGMDFIMESVSDIPYLIEMNPRCTQLGHIEMSDLKTSLAGAFCAVLGASAAALLHAVIPSSSIALFPQAIAAGDACRRYIDSSYHDVPVDEPRLKEELLLVPWPRRRWIARIYHSFKPLKHTEAVFFENILGQSPGRNNDVDNCSSEPAVSHGISSR